MKTETLSIEQFLDLEDRQGTDLLAVIEKDPANAEHVRVTPWRGKGCHCHSTLSVARKLIASVEQTSNTHYCCGGSHIVVKVNFAEGAAIPVAEIFRQLAMTPSTEDFSSATHVPSDSMSVFSAGDMERGFSAPYETSTRPIDNPFCVATTLTKKTCGPIIDRDGRLVRGPYSAWVPSRFINRMTGQPCNIHIDPCG